MLETPKHSEKTCNLVAFHNFEIIEEDHDLNE